MASASKKRELEKLEREQRKDAATSRVSRRAGTVAFDERADAASSSGVAPIAARAKKPPRGYRILREEFRLASEDLPKRIARLQRQDPTADPRRGALIRDADQWETDLPTATERAALSSVIAALQSLADSEAWSPDEKQVVHGAHVAAFGAPPGERWTVELERVLLIQHESLAAIALKLRGRKDAFGSSKEMLEEVRRHAPDVPIELTPTLITKTLEQTTLGRGGGRGVQLKNIRTAIMVLRDGFAKKIRKPQKRRVKRRKSKTR